MYLVQFKIDNGLCMIEDTKFETKDNVEIGTVKHVKYGTSYLDATIVGIGKYIVYLHINCIYNIVILFIKVTRNLCQKQKIICWNKKNQKPTNEK